MIIAIGDNHTNALEVAGDGIEESIMYTKVSNITDGTTNDNIKFALDVTSFEKAIAAIGVSRICDMDMAKEMTNFSKNNILQQAAQSMFAQANQSTQGVLTLLR